MSESTNPLPPDVRAAIERLRDNVCGLRFDWAYVECNTGVSHYPNLQDDFRTVIAYLDLAPAAAGG